jgi:hypothetical protein
MKPVPNPGTNAIQATTRMPDPGKNYKLTEEAVELLLTLFINHKECLQQTGGSDDEFEVELTDSLLELLEDTNGPQQ